MDIFLLDLEDIDRVIAYNAMFDFKKSIVFIKEYFKQLKTKEYQE